MRSWGSGMVWLAAFALAACGTEDTAGLDPTDAGADATDAGVVASADAGAPEDAGPADTGAHPTTCAPDFVETSELPAGSSLFGPARAAFWAGDLVVAVPRLTTFTGTFGDVFDAATVGLYRPDPAGVSLAFASGSHPLRAVRSIAAFGDDLLISGQGPTTLSPEAIGGLIARVLPGERNARYSTWTGVSADGRVQATATATVGGLIAFTSDGRRPSLRLWLEAPGEELDGSTTTEVSLDAPIEHLALVPMGGRRVRAISIEAGALVVRAIDVGADGVEVLGRTEGFEGVRHLEAATVGDRIVAIVQRTTELHLLEAGTTEPPVVQARLPVSADALTTSAAREDRLAIAVHDAAAGAPTVYFFDPTLSLADAWSATRALPTQPALRPTPRGLDLAAGDGEWGLVVSYDQVGEGERAYHHVVRFGDCAL